MESEAKETFIFWKNLAVIAIFFTVTPLVLGVSLFSLFSFQNSSKNQVVNAKQENFYSKSGARVFASLPSVIPAINGLANPSDARGEIIKQYLKAYNSPLTPYADFIVQTADKYEIDFRLTTAIAQQESNLCKMIPPGSYNCWGWGIHSQGSLSFNSFAQGIEEVSKGLREEYLDKDLITVEEIMSKYTPLSNGSWAFGVNKFLSEME